MNTLADVEQCKQRKASVIVTVTHFTVYECICVRVCVYMAAGDAGGSDSKTTHAHTHGLPGRVQQDPIIPLLPAIHMRRSFFCGTQQTTTRLFRLCFTVPQLHKSSRIFPQYINAAADRPLTHTQEVHFAYTQYSGISSSSSSSTVICVSITLLLIKGSPAGPHRGNLPLGDSCATNKEPI